MYLWESKLPTFRRPKSIKQANTLCRLTSSVSNDPNPTYHPSLQGDLIKIESSTYNMYKLFYTYTLIYPCISTYLIHISFLATLRSQDPHSYNIEGSIKSPQVYSLAFN